jgi:hypothetical protein
VQTTINAWFWNPPGLPRESQAVVTFLDALVSNRFMKKTEMGHPARIQTTYLNYFVKLWSPPPRTKSAVQPGGETVECGHVPGGAHITIVLSAQRRPLAREPSSSDNSQKVRQF